ncbi:MAG TPA: A/G-specific adenine glycosylase [Burkholderiales bacterium]|nr:A/G-specific adenine glycosylase [Burkholderiales bacterium]
MSFAEKLIAWQRRHGRHGLPWQGTRDPYRIWLSEIMLQQTQVSAVIPYYQRFLAKYSTVKALAAASEDEVLRLWSGLGYYARGRNLHQAAQEIQRRGFPRSAMKIVELPGVGRSTAAAIAVFAFGERAAILDANVKRVLARCFGTEEDLWALAERLLPGRDIRVYTQALMDLGATVCTRNPDCGACPVRSGCVARKTGRIAELPAARPKKALPLKRTTWFVYRDRGKVLLERRPSPGIWGGLWCFPEKADTTFPVRSPKKLTPIDHGFTHFRLRIQPLLFEGTFAEARGRLWIDLAEAPAAAVPTPVKKLLQDLQRNATRGGRSRR